MKSDSKSKSEEKDLIGFESKLRRLEEIVSELESDPVDLDMSLKSYEEGVALVKECLEKLKTAELKVQELSLEE